MITARIIEKMKEYLEVPATTRFEEPFLDYLENDFAKLGCKVKREEGLLVVEKGEASKNLLTCHIDREGLFVNENKGVEYVVYYMRKRNGQTVRGTKDKAHRIGSDFVGSKIYSYDDNGKVLQEGQVKKYHFDEKEEMLFFDVEGFDNLEPDMAFSFGNNLKVDNTYISGQIDNVISVATLYALVETDFEGTILFGVQEEIGRSGIFIAKYLEKENLNSQNIISIDITPYGDKEVVDNAWVVLRNKDGRGEFNKEYVNVVKETCINEKLGFQMKDELLDQGNKDKPYKGLGFTELGQIIKASGGKFSGATVQLPVWHEKMHIETTSYKALHNYYFLLKKITE